MKTSKARCMDKKAFWSYAAGKRAAKRRGEVYGDRPRTYKCDNCELWHHTTKPLKADALGEAQEETA